MGTKKNALQNALHDAGMKGILTGALTSASVVISLTAFTPMAYATNVTSVEISVDMPKAGKKLASEPEIVGVTPAEAQGSISISNVAWEGADQPGAKSGTYNLSFDLEATGDYEFDALATYVVNSSAADVKVDYGNTRQATVTTPFKVIAENSLTDLYKISYHQNFFDWTEKTVKRTPFASVEVPSMESDFSDWLSIAEQNGYHFACWSTSPWSCDDPANPDKVTTTGAQYAAGEAIDLRSDVDLYAQWTIGTYGIIFDANLPDATAPAFSAFPADGAKLSYSQAAAELEFAGFSREGYKLVGFSADRNSTEPEYGLEDEIEVTDANVLLHAIWRLDDGTDESEDSEGEKKEADGEKTDAEKTDSEESEDKKAEGDQGETDDGADTDAEGMDKDADSSDSSSSDDLVGIDYDGDGVIDAYEKVETAATTSLLGASNARALASQSDGVTYSVKYNANGGDGSMAEEEVDPTNPYFLNNNEFTRDGYRFVGWSRSSRTNDGDERLNPGDAIYVEENMTLYAQWESDVRKVTFDANGGTNAPASRTYDAGASYTLPKDKPTYDNYAFGGWLDSVSNSVYQPGDEYGTLDSDVTFTAVWGDSYKITFDANGGSGNMDALVVPRGEATTLPQNKFKKSKAEFLGWSESMSSTTPTYQDREMNVQFSYDTTLYAVWGESSSSSSSSGSSSSSSSSSDSDSSSSSSSRSGTTYAISYRPNSGSGSMDKQSVPSGESIVLEGSDFTREGYTFVGWNTSASGSGTAYVPGDTVTPTSNMSLYAQWVPSDGADPSSASSSGSSSRSALEDDADTISAEPMPSPANASSSSNDPKAPPPSTADPQRTAPVILAGISGVLTVIGAKLLRKKSE